MDLADRAAPGDPVVPVARVAPVITRAVLVAPVVLVDPVTRAVLVAPAAPITPAALVARVDPAITPAGPADPGALAITPTDSVDRILTLAARGTEMTTAATSTGHRGARARHPGVRASRRGRHGIDRFPRPVGAGTTARSTTGATTKPRTGTPVSISGDLTSSECGSRCDR
ncbi:hypothetical protein A5620_16805 [Mycobacterium colombiense]|nr:hypothetical protein A5620_16805 [Mycobacterium colombiense]